MLETVGETTGFTTVGNVRLTLDMTAIEGADDEDLPPRRGESSSGESTYDWSGAGTSTTCSSSVEEAPSQDGEESLRRRNLRTGGTSAAAAKADGGGTGVAESSEQEDRDEKTRAVDDGSAKQARVEVRILGIGECMSRILLWWFGLEKRQVESLQVYCQELESHLVAKCELKAKIAGRVMGASNNGGVGEL